MERSITLDARAIITATLLGGLLSSDFVPSSRGAEPLKLHPENPHYVVFRGKPTVLVASTEHYGAVLNRDFDFRPYLDELKAAGLNYTRAFSGVYSEPWGEPFNTLNPPGGRLLAPWARGATPGYADGGNKFDLDKWDDAYFKRLREFIAEAGKRGVVVELTLFCNWYDDNQWHLSPLYVRNNVNGVGDRDSKQVNSLQSGDLLKHQEAMVRKVVAEVNDLENVFFEVCNEPGAEGDWMDRMAEVIWEAEGKLPNRHLIANNGHPVPHMAIFNAHYDRDGSFVRGNYGRNLVVGYDETGFDGASDLPYRRQGWHFLLSGGGLYDNLDWSFSVAHPDGSETKWDKKLGGGSPALRRQLGVLLAFLEGFDLARLKPDKGVVKGGAPGNFSVLAEPGKQYAIYLDGGDRAELQVDLPAGDYAAAWIDTRTGAKARAEDVSGGGVRTLKSPGYAEDIALRILRKGPAPRGGE
jgi:hypothetical protein